LRLIKQLKDSLENGTYATAVPLFKANEEDMCIKEVKEAFDCAPSLSIKDIALTGNEVDHLRENMIHTVLQIAVLFGGEGLQKY
jgi:hypothetical protein